MTTFLAIEVEISSKILFLVSTMYSIYIISISLLLDRAVQLPNCRDMNSIKAALLG